MFYKKFIALMLCQEINYQLDNSSSDRRNRILYSAIHFWTVTGQAKNDPKVAHQFEWANNSLNYRTLITRFIFRPIVRSEFMNASSGRLSEKFSPGRSNGIPLTSDMITVHYAFLEHHSMLALIL